MVSRSTCIAVFSVSNIAIFPGCYNSGEKNDDKVIFTKDYIIDALGIKNEDIVYSNVSEKISSTADSFAFLSDVGKFIKGYVQKSAEDLKKNNVSEPQINNIIYNQHFFIISVKFIGDINSTSQKGKFGAYLAKFDFNINNIKKDKVIQIDTKLDNNAIEAQLKKYNQEFLCVVKLARLNDFFEAFNSGFAEAAKICTFACFPAK